MFWHPIYTENVLNSAWRKSKRYLINSHNAVMMLPLSVALLATVFLFFFFFFKTKSHRELSSVVFSGTRFRKGRIAQILMTHPFSDHLGHKQLPSDYSSIVEAVIAIMVELLTREVESVISAISSL